MLDRLPEYIDPLHLVEKRQGFKGTIALEKMGRLASLLTEPSGNAELEIQFGRDSAGLAIATGKVTAVVRLQCQRCLESMDFSVNSEFTLGVVASVAETRNLPENYEPLVTGQGHVSLAELVEDEILLALPAIAMHTENCSVSRLMPDDSRSRASNSMYNAPKATESVEANDGRQNPFAMLADLKEKLKK